MGKRQEAMLITKQKLIDAVKALLKEKRADEINIEEITARAGVAKGTFHTHFKRREDVISVIAMECYNALLGNVLNSSGSALQKLKSYLVRSAKIIEENTLEIAQNWAKSVTAPVDGERHGIEKYNFDRENIISFLKGGIIRGELYKDTPVERLADGIMQGYYGAVFVWCLTSGETSLESALKNFCDTMLPPLLGQYENKNEKEINDE